MKAKSVKWRLILLCTFCITGVQAQIYLNVQEKSGTQTSFILGDIKKLVFTSGTMTINKQDGNNYDFSMANVRNMNFVDITLSAENPEESGSMLLYPNPVSDHLQVRYENTSEVSISVTIINIQGDVVFQQILKSEFGTNHVNIPLLTLQKGMYLCRIKKGNEIEMHKFIKN